MELRMRFEHLGKSPVIHGYAFVAPDATLCGDVAVARGARVMHGARIVAEGGKIRFGENSIVMQNADGGTHSPSGVYEKVVANELLVFSWKWADSELITRVTIEFRELGAAETELRLTHEGFPDSGIADKHEEGWTGCLARLRW